MAKNNKKKKQSGSVWKKIIAWLFLIAMVLSLFSMAIAVMFG